jgi:hypothetical protein
MSLSLRYASNLFRRPIAKLQTTPLHIQQASFSRTARSMASEYKLKGLTSVDLKNGQKAEYEVEGIEGGKVLLVKAQDGLHAMSPNCTHYGAPLVTSSYTCFSLRENTS